MKRRIAMLVDIRNDSARYAKGMYVDYIEGDMVHLISIDGKWEVNFDWKKFIPEFMNEVRKRDEEDNDE